MKMRDYLVQGRRGSVGLHEKGGKEHEVPCHHSLEQYLDDSRSPDNELKLGPETARLQYETS